MTTGQNSKPNIVYILADDMGYGDMGCNDPTCRIPTPNLDRLAAGGMRFTDAHATSAVCTPSRYGILTGRYNWRSRLKRGVTWEWDGALLEPDRPTVASMLKAQGYATACIGKWHLGWDWPTVDGRHPNETLPFGAYAGDVSRQREQFGVQQIDYAGRIAGGPVDRGFDHYFGVDVPNFPPYAWFEDDRLTELPTERKPDDMFGRPGLMAPGWSLEAMIPEFTRRAVAYIEDRDAGPPDASSEPFFLYLPLTSPHTPVVPNEAFKGMSGIGVYGDFVCEADWVVGQVMDALERTKQTEDTLVVFTSDNGPEHEIRGQDEGAYLRAERTGHYSMGPLRGIKHDAWEGGHRVPFIASWPNGIPAGSTCDQLVGQQDLLATCADILEQPLPAGAGEDSVSMLPMLRGQTDRPTRSDLVHHSNGGKFALRTGEWVYIESASGGANRPEAEWFNAQRGYEPHDQPAELFNLREDLAERVNRYAERPDIADRLAQRLYEIRGEDSVPHGSAPNRSLSE